MKKCVIFLMFCSFLLTCGQHQQEPDPLVEPEKPCGCCNVEPIEEYTWYRELVWDYPYNGGFDDWVLNNQIPDDVLYALSTEELLEICIRFPFLTYRCVFYTQSGIHCNDCMDDVISSFNGLSELFKRENCIDELLKRYDEIVKNIAAVCFDSKSIYWIFEDLEILIGRYQCNDDNAIEVYREILRHLVNGFEAKLLFPEIFSSSSLCTNFIARSNMIEKLSPGTLLSKIELEWWVPQYFSWIPCWAHWYPDMDEYIVINELSYELIQ